MGLRPLACWDCGFESRAKHGCLSLVSVVCCKAQISAMGRSLVQGSPTVYVFLRAYMCVCVRVQPSTLTMGRSKRPEKEKKRGTEFIYEYYTNIYKGPG